MIQPCLALSKREGTAAREFKPALPKIQKYCKGLYIDQTMDAGGTTDKNNEGNAGAIYNGIELNSERTLQNKIEIAQLAPATKTHKKNKGIINPGTTCSLKKQARLQIIDD